ncbi:MAG: hypothetical protein V2B13_13520 [Pseudomonadota bacterium]
MKNPVKIMHIDADYQVHYIIVQNGSLIHSTIPLQTAVKFLKTMEFDLIISEPQNKALMKKNEKNSTHQKTLPKPIVSCESNPAPIHPE